MQIDRLRAELATYKAAMELAANEWEFYVSHGDANGTPAVFLKVNDTFGYALADCEKIPWEEIPAILALFKHGGWEAVVRLIGERRGQQPIPEMLESMSRTEKLRLDMATAQQMFEEQVKKLEAALSRAERAEAQVDHLLRKRGLEWAANMRASLLQITQQIRESAPFADPILDEAMRGIVLQAEEALKP